MTDQWTALMRLVGRWEGTASGRPGVGHQVRTYETVLGGVFIKGTNTTRWAPTTQEPAGETHEDLCLIGRDQATGQAVMRSFFVEGFYCEYRCVEASPDGSRLVFEAGRVDNGPAGLRARETLVFVSSDEIEASFALANGDADFSPYTEERLTRVTDLRG